MLTNMEIIIKYVNIQSEIFHFLQAGFTNMTRFQTKRRAARPDAAPDSDKNHYLAGGLDKPDRFSR